MYSNLRFHRKKEERIKSYFEDLLYGENFMLNERETILKVRIKMMQLFSFKLSYDVLFLNIF